jgi:hypothetical protein
MGIVARKFRNLEFLEGGRVISVTEDLETFTDQFTGNIMQNFLGSSVGSKYGFTTLQSSVQVSSSK